MNFLIYGNDRPKIGFVQKPDGGISFKIENDLKLRFKPDQYTISWKDAYPYSYRFGNMFGSPTEDKHDRDVFDSFTGELAELAGSEVERAFFDEYASACWSNYDEPWSAPALIPQVWVNWIHYDPQDKKRAERAQREPFRVDFVMKDGRVARHPIIIEIDGASHFGHYSVDQVGKTVLNASMNSYTEHLRKDRWLRKNGWQVYRVSSQEVEEAKSISKLFQDLFSRGVDDHPF